MRNSPTVNGQTALQTVRKREQGRTAWELAELIRPLREPSRHSVNRPRMLRHYPAVVEYVYNSRLATADQVRRRFGEQIRSGRTGQYQLARLVDLGLLATAPVRSTSVHFPRVYLATEKGIGLIRDTYAEHGIAWQASPGEERKARGKAQLTVLHEILLTEFELQVAQAAEARPRTELLEQERRYYRRDRRLHFTVPGKSRHVEPDAGFLLATKDGGERRLMQYFVEMDNGTMSAARLRRKFQAYETWSRSEEGRTYLERCYDRFDSRPPKNLFRLLVIGHDKLRPNADVARTVELLEIAAELSRGMRRRVWLVSATDLKELGQRASLLSSTVWLRPRDLPLAGENSPRSSLTEARGNGVDHMAHLTRYALLDNHSTLDSPGDGSEGQAVP